MKGNIEGPVVKANDLEGSNLYQVLILPEDDDLFMPPKGGALDADQIDTIKRWITEGAKPLKIAFLHQKVVFPHWMNQ